MDAVLLDLDDTLVDTRHAFRVALGEVAGEWLPHLDGDEFEAVVEHWTGDPGGHFGAYRRGEIDFARQRRLRAGLLHAVFDGPALDDPEFARWESVYEAAFSSSWRLCPDAVAFLDWLDAERLPFAVVTNAAGPYQWEKLRAVSLDQRVRVLVGIDALGVGKPDPRIFRLGCERLGVDPSRSLYVGDELDVDARGAQAAGLIGVWLDRHGSGLTPDDVPVVRSLAELPALILAL